VRINVQLIDALSGGHVWAEKYDGDMGDIFKLQDEVVAKIVYSLDQNIVPQINLAETDVPEAHDLFLQGLRYYYLHDPESMSKAIEFFKQATELDPNYFRAHAQLALAYGWIIDSGWKSELGMTYDQVKELMSWSLKSALKKPTSSAFLASAWLQTSNGQNEVALVEIDKAIALNPNDPYNFTMKAYIMSRIGLAKEIEVNALRAIRLNPKNAAIHIRLLGKGLFHQDRFIEAAEAFEEAAMLEPYYEWNYLSLAATYGHLGELPKARTALEKFEEIRADREHEPSTVEEISKWREATSLIFNERLFAGLRKAGMPER